MAESRWDQEVNELWAAPPNEAEWGFEGAEVWAQHLTEYQWGQEINEIWYDDVPLVFTDAGACLEIHASTADAVELSVSAADVEAGASTADAVELAGTC